MGLSRDLKFGQGKEVIPVTCYQNDFFLLVKEFINFHTSVYFSLYIHNSNLSQNQQNHSSEVLDCLVL